MSTTMKTTAVGSDAQWGARTVRRLFRSAGYLEAGERASVEALGEDLEGARVLDLAVGTGRTTAFLRPPARTYVGIDSSPEMIATARLHFPGVDFRVGDVRDLRPLEDASADVVMFSFNSIDAVNPSERATVLAEIHRVLAPGGRLLISMLNLADGAADRPRLADVRHALRREAWQHPRGALFALWASIVQFRNYRAVAPLAVEAGDWAWRPMRAHEFRFVVHYSRFGHAVRELRGAGFPIDGAWSSTGTPLDLTAERVSADYMHFLCTRA
jgi:ubiquinone/menaquinone biosynthesis C-methylase UbiE